MPLSSWKRERERFLTSVITIKHSRIILHLSGVLLLKSECNGSIENGHWVTRNVFRFLELCKPSFCEIIFWLSAEEWLYHNTPFKRKMVCKFIKKWFLNSNTTEAILESLLTATTDLVYKFVCRTISIFG